MIIFLRVSAYCSIISHEVGSASKFALCNGRGATLDWTILLRDQLLALGDIMENTRIDGFTNVLLGLSCWTALNRDGDSGDLGLGVLNLCDKGRIKSTAGPLGRIALV